MLVTSLCWWLYDGDWFEMLVAESLLATFFVFKSVTNISNLSPTHLVSNIRRQHRCNHFIFINDRFWSSSIIFTCMIWNFIKEVTRLKEEPIWYDPDAMSVNSSPTSPETERKKKESTSMGSDRGDKECFIFFMFSKYQGINVFLTTSKTYHVVLLRYCTHVIFYIFYFW